MHFSMLAVIGSVLVLTTIASLWRTLLDVKASRELLVRGEPRATLWSGGQYH